MHPKPADDPPPHPARSISSAPNDKSDENVAIDTDLIRLDT